MNTRLSKSVLEVIRREQDLRASLLNEDSEIAYNHWTFRDAPFVAELCLMLLVASNHQVERELLRLAARAADDGREIDPKHFEKRVKELWNNRKLEWNTINTRLNLESCVGHKEIKVLRLVANCYKHEPTEQPNDELLRLLGLETGVCYAPLPESGDLREGLARFVGLEASADYCQIVERFLDIIDSYLAEVKQEFYQFRQMGRRVPQSS